MKGVGLLLAFCCAYITFSRTNGTTTKGPTQNSPKRNFLLLRGQLPVVSPFPRPRPVQRPGPNPRHTCKRHRIKYKQRGVCSARGCQYVSCPVFTCNELAFFKTEDEIQRMAIEYGATYLGTAPLPNKSSYTGRIQAASSVGCATETLLARSPETVIDECTNKSFTLAQIPAGCGTQLFQPVLAVFCPYDQCCGGNGQCNPVKRRQHFVVIEFGQVVIKEVCRIACCQCVNAV